MRVLVVIVGYFLVSWLTHQGQHRADRRGV